MTTLNHMPATPMSQAEMERQVALVTEIARALDYYTEEELERHADELRQNHAKRRPEETEPAG